MLDRYSYENIGGTGRPLKCVLTKSTLVIGEVSEVVALNRSLIVSCFTVKAQLGLCWAVQNFEWFPPVLSSNLTTKTLATMTKAVCQKF